LFISCNLLLGHEGEQPYKRVSQRHQLFLYLKWNWIACY